MKNLVYLLTLFAFTLFAVAQERSVVRGLGMAGSNTATTRGIDAIGINPANLAIPDRGLIQIGFASVGFRVSSELINYDIYQRYFTGVPGTGGTRVSKYLTDADKNELLGQWPDFGESRLDVDINLMNVSFESLVVGGIGFAIRDRMSGVWALPKDYVKIYFFGLPEAGAMYNLGGTSISGMWFREYNFSYARKLPEFIPFVRNVYVGIGYKLVRGYGYFETSYYRSTFGNSVDNVGQYAVQGTVDFFTRRSGADFMSSESKTNFTPFPEPAGKGSAFDFGVSAEVMTGMRVAASVTDLGKILWDKNVYETSGNAGFSFTGNFEETKDSLEHALKGETKRVNTSFETSLPSQFHAGVMMRSDQVSFLRWMPGQFTLAADYLQGLKTVGASTTKPRFSFGAEYRLIPLIPVRAGLALGGNDKPRLAAGFGLDVRVLSLDFAIYNFGMLFSPKNFQMVSLAVGLKARI